MKKSCVELCGKYSLRFMNRSLSSGSQFGAACVITALRVWQESSETRQDRFLTNQIFYDDCSEFFRELLWALIKSDSTKCQRIGRRVLRLASVVGHGQNEPTAGKRSLDSMARKLASKFGLRAPWQRRDTCLKNGARCLEFLRELLSALIKSGPTKAHTTGRRLLCLAAILGHQSIHGQTLAKLAREIGVTPQCLYKLARKLAAEIRLRAPCSGGYLYRRKRSVVRRRKQAPGKRSLRNNKRKKQINET
jgi:hypothetical protein